MICIFTYGCVLEVLKLCIYFSSKVKPVNDLLFGIHLATAAEAMVLGARAGLNTRILFDIISNAAGSSWYALQPTATVY